MMLGVKPRRREAPYGDTEVNPQNYKLRPTPEIFSTLSQGMGYQMGG